MEDAITILEPLGDGDEHLVDIDRRRRGLPPCERELVCQHSCAAEDIPGCQDPNCEGTSIVNSTAIADACFQVESGELERIAGLAPGLPNLTRDGRRIVAAGSLAAFARFCAVRIQPGISDAARRPYPYPFSRRRNGQIASCSLQERDRG